MEQDQALYLLTAGRLPTWPEREHWQRLLNRNRRLCLVIIVLLTAFFAYYILTGLTAGVHWTRALITIVIMAAASVTVILSPTMRNHRIRNQMQTTWYDEQADRKRLAAGYTVALYGDRVVRTDLRGATTLFFDRITSCTETPQGFCLMAGSATVLIRSADLTYDQITTIRDHLRARLPGSVFRVKGEAVACLTEPLPIPFFDNTDVVISRATMVFRRPWLRSRRLRELRALQNTVVVPAMLVYGTALADLMTVTGTFLLDLLLFCGGAVIGGILLTRLLTAFGGKPTTVYLAVTREGLAAYGGGRHFFTVWERCRPTAEKGGLRVQFADGNTLFIPWSCFEQPEAIQDFVRR